MMRFFERIWGLLKLIDLYFTRRRYEGYAAQFFERRGDCYWGIGWKAGAALDYHSAMKELDNQGSAGLHAKLGGVYTELWMYDKALRHYRIAYKKNKWPAIGIGLAQALYNTGHMDGFMGLVARLQSVESKIPRGLQKEFERLILLRWTIIGQMPEDNASYYLAQTLTWMAIGKSQASAQK